MKLYSSNESYKLYQGNMLDMLEVIEPNSIDSIITDPPYELNFMSKGWDNAGVSFQTDTWKKCYDVLKDGGYLLAFGGSRTFHRIACAIEDAGFEIRDTIMWLYGSGFPKSMNISLSLDKKQGLQNQRGIGGFNVGGIQEQQNRKAKLYIGSTTDGSKQKAYTDFKSDLSKKWGGWGTALKPSFEPIIVARKPFKGSLVDNVIKNGVGGINIDECRVAYEKTANPATKPLYRQQNVDKYKQVQGGELSNGAVSWTSGKNGVNENGRFPANTILTYDETDFDEVCGGFPNTKSQKATFSNDRFKKWKEQDGCDRNIKGGSIEYGFNDSGSASRYFYCAKASKKDRDEGCELLDDTVNACSNQAIAELKRGNDNFSDETNSTFNKVYKGKNTHPTVKPTNLMQYLVRLVTPNGGTILDPFNGSGSTGKAVMYENKEKNKNYKYIGIELTEEYLPISKARIEYVCNLIEKEKKEDKQISIFDELEG